MLWCVCWCRMHVVIQLVVRRLTGVSLRVAAARKCFVFATGDGSWSVGVLLVARCLLLDTSVLTFDLLLHAAQAQASAAPRLFVKNMQLR